MPQQTFGRQQLHASAEVVRHSDTSDTDVETSAKHAIDEVQKLEKSHAWDPSLPAAKAAALHRAVETHDAELARGICHTLEDEEPYEDVEAAVKLQDGGEIANTIRAWVLGMTISTIVTALNMFLSMRNPAISIPVVVPILLVYPCAIVWAKIVPTRRFRWFGTYWTLNTGPFTIKEHAVITLMANVTNNYAYSTDALIALKAKPLYNLDLGWGFQLLFTLSSQLLGLAIAGMFRRYVVWPASLLWPGNFSTTSLLYTLHDGQKTRDVKSNGWRISRYRWFMLLTFASFAYYWLPGVLWQGLSVFAFVTWIRPNNATLNQLFGGFTGLSLIPLTFDWTYVSAYLQDPLLSPAYAHANTLLGLGIFVVLPAIGISYTGAFFSDYLPMSTSTTFDNTGSQYNVSRILGPSFTFDLAKYESYSPMFLAPTFALNYGLSFAACTAAIVHTVLYHGREIRQRMPAIRLRFWQPSATQSNEPQDYHMRQILRYSPAPDWWYLLTFVAAFVIGLGTTLGYTTQLPGWAYLISIVLPLIFIIPCCIIMGMTNIQLSLNVLSPFIAGFLIPGHPIGVMIFKVFSTIVLGQAQVMARDLKMAHYMAIPPRVTFWSQVIPSVWACVVQIAVMNWMLGTIEGVCEAEQKNHFTCPTGRTFFSNSITWGVIGPQRMFGPGSRYMALQWFWLLGAMLPIVLYMLMRYVNQRRPPPMAQTLKSWKVDLLHAPVMLGAMQWLPPANPLSFSSWAIVGLIFNYWIKRRWNGWWMTYNYITAAALDAGLVIATIVVFFAITLPNVTVPQWWGNVAVFETMDAMGTAVRKTVADGQTFGPQKW